MNHPIDQIKGISEYAKNLDPEGVREYDTGALDRFLDKGFVTDKVSGDYDTSSMLPVSSDGFPSNQEELANVFMICDPDRWREILGQMGDLDENGNLVTYSHHLPSPSALELNYLSTSQLGNFLTWTPSGTEFPNGVEINEAVAGVPV